MNNKTGGNASSYGNRYGKSGQRNKNHSSSTSNDYKKQNEGKNENNRKVTQERTNNVTYRKKIRSYDRSSIDEKAVKDRIKKPIAFETVKDIREDIIRIEKEIELEIREIRSLKL